MDIETAQKKPSNKRPLTVLSILVLLVIAAAVFWYFFLREQTTTSTPTQKTITTTTTTTTTEKTTTPEVAVVDDTALITKALVSKTGIAVDKIDVTVSNKVDNFAKGMVSTKGEEIGGGYYLAVKVGNDWTIVYDGQATPDCSVITPYNFPASMVPECLDAGGSLVKR